MSRLNKDDEALVSSWDQVLADKGATGLRQVIAGYGLDPSELLSLVHKLMLAPKSKSEAKRHEAQGGGYQPDSDLDTTDPPQGKSGEYDGEDTRL